MHHSKFPPLSRTSLEDFKDALTAGHSFNDFCLGDFNASLLVTPPEGDAILREAAQHGYVLFDRKNDTFPPSWRIGTLGRILMNQKDTRFKADIVKRHIDMVIKRAREINKESGHLFAITSLKLYGSALHDDLPDYGDIDLEIEVDGLPLSKAAKKRRVNTLYAAASKSRKNRGWDIPIVVANDLDQSNIRRRITQGLHTLSVNVIDEIDMLGCEYKRIYRFDVQTRKELPADKEITPRSSPPLHEQIAAEITPLPDRTCIRPKPLSKDQLPTAAVDKPDLTDIHRSLADAWAGEWQGDEILPMDVSSNSSMATSMGAMELTLWAEPGLTGSQIVKKTYAWAESKGIDLPDKTEKAIVRTQGKSLSVIFGPFEFFEGKLKYQLWKNNDQPIALSADYTCFAMNLFHGLKRIHQEAGLGSNGDSMFVLDMSALLHGDGASMPNLQESKAALATLMKSSVAKKHKADGRKVEIEWFRDHFPASWSWSGHPKNETAMQIDKSISEVVAHVEDDLRPFQPAVFFSLSFATSA